MFGCTLARIFEAGAKKMKYIVMPLWRCFDFAGRSRRKEFWFFVVPLIVVMASIVGVIGSAGLGDRGDIANAASKALAGVGLMALIPTLSLIVRRLHDQDRSGWLVLVWAVPMLAWIMAMVMPSLADPMIGRAMLIAFGTVLIVMSIKGTQGPNKFGPDPRV